MNVSSMNGVARILAGLLIGYCSGMSALAGAAGMIARTWDQEISLPPGGYRAPKPIQMYGSFTVNLVPGTYVENVDFFGKAHDQKFKIEGTLLRKSKLIGQLGFKVDARDSAFDECEMHRTGGWFVDMWGTRWTFENCVFNRSFLLPEIDVGNYAIHARRCDFLGVKMPAIKYKNDPSKYVQGNDLRFEKCRFSECEIPETLLAACVDCAFDNCQFPSKKGDWSKASEPVKVLATIVGLGHVPQSYLNGKLSVQFVSAPKVDAGASVPYSPAGGRLALSNVQIPQQFTMLGTTEKKASEIPDFGSPATTGGFPPANATPAPVAANEIRTLDDLLRAIPSSAQLATNGAINPTGVEAANAQLGKTLNGNPVALRLWLDDVRPTQDGGFAFKATAREVPLTFRGLTIPVQVVFLFRQSDAAALGKVTKGTDSTVRGTILKTELQGRNRGLGMVVTVGNAQLP
jgi:hypothetical protein